MAVVTGHLFSTSFGGGRQRCRGVVAGPLRKRPAALVGATILVALSACSAGLGRPETGGERPSIAPDTGPAFGQAPCTRIAQAPWLARETLSHLWARGEDDIWVVADRGALHRFDGTRWTRAIEADVTRPLNDVHGTSSGEVIAVGQRGLVLAYDGARWESLSIADRENVFGVWVLDGGRAIAVGSDGGIYERSGGSWTHPLVAPWDDPWSGHRDALFAVWGVGSTDAWAVGELGVVLRWDGSTWAHESSGTTALLVDVWGSGTDDVWAVGQGGTILHRDGHAWTARPEVEGYTLIAVSGTGPGDVWILGRSRAPDPDLIESDPHGLLLHGNGASLSRVAELRPPPNDIFAVAPGTTLVVGEDATVLRCRATR